MNETPFKHVWAESQLRDLIAIAAMQGELSCQSSNYEWPDSDAGRASLAARCYKISDAMLAERAKQP